MDKTDIHCHLLPGVDDGSAGIEETLELLKMEAKDGVHHIVLTPHLRHRMFETPDEEIIKRFKQLIEIKNERRIRVELSLSREYHYDKSMVKAITEDRLLLMNGNVMLVEFSHDTSYETMAKAVLKFRNRGITPLIAHIERYACVQEDPEKAKAVKESGALIQVNAGSILGEEGRKEKKTALELVKQNAVFCVASDAHDLKYRRPNLKKCEIFLVKKFGEKYAEKVLCTNPQKLFKSYERILDNENN